MTDSPDEDDDENVSTQLFPASFPSELHVPKLEKYSTRDMVKSRRCRLTFGPITDNRTGKKIKLCNVPNRMIPKYIRK